MYLVTYPDGVQVGVESRFQAETLTARFGGAFQRTDGVLPRSVLDPILDPTPDDAWDEYVDWYNGKDFNPPPDRCDND